ncbi:peptidoglycan DD-metalloendopeptidase family protein [uncultured Desulfuromusa sp.]|uniref:peptidoglycan DD-metalloendopeptidase family protein n=1 Tax=uncultured Desulfuromusa sp. TaxID=219183 RepID=UPI002AA71FD3|nr:peptidoglycan DD-metalloendopeptidase family protein [uncultured Desulfuromusa sp.]
MRYPYIAYSPDIEIQPLFEGLKGTPLIIDMSNKGVIFEKMDVRDQCECQRRIEQLMSVGNHTWGISSYLENRQHLLSNCPQMVKEQRFYHLGLDIIVPLGTPLHAPLAATVEASSYEAGEGNYGGNVLLRHENSDYETFYSLYGHLNRKTLPSPGTLLRPGDTFGHIGDFCDNGNWFYHTHLQVITEKGLKQGYLSKGYCSGQDLAGMDDLCPAPLTLFRI